MTKPSLEEDVGGVVRDNVDAAELLHEHENEGGEGCPTVSWDCEEFECTIAAVEGRFGF